MRAVESGLQNTFAPQTGPAAIPFIHLKILSLSSLLRIYPRTSDLDQRIPILTRTWMGQRIEQSHRVLQVPTALPHGANGTERGKSAHNVQFSTHCVRCARQKERGPWLRF
jgi:hypothetical protein